MSEAIALQELDENYHSPYSPSTLPMNMRCAAAFRRNQGVKDEAGDAAERGTAIHWVSEVDLTDDSVVLDDFKGLKAPNGYLIDAEMIACAREYVDFVNALPGEKLIEQRVSYGRWAEGQSGTADCVVLPRWDEERQAYVLHIADLKGGKGVQVFAKYSEQLRAYALGVIETFEFLFERPVDLIDMTIVQPAFDHIETWTQTYEELMAFGEELRAAYAASMEPTSGATPGKKQCQWCKIKGRCPELSEMVTKEARDGFQALEDLPKDELLPAEKVGELKQQFAMWQSVMSAVNKQAAAYLNKGEEVPGFKLVETNKHRKTRDEGELVAWVEENMFGKGEDLYEKKMLSPSKIEQIIGSKGKKALWEENKRRLDNGEEPLIVKPEGEPTVASEDDKRAAIVVNLTEGFEAQ